MKPSTLLIYGPLLFISLQAGADTATVTINSIDEQGVGADLGTVKISDTTDGLALKPELKNLSPGKHGWHIHQTPDCGPAEKDGKMAAGMAAGGHYDPATTNKHAGPKGTGHMGDLPVLVVAADGKATRGVTVARLKLADIKGRALMIHVAGDNYADEPKPLGGGGGRVACGIIN